MGHQLDLIHRSKHDYRLNLNYFPIRLDCVVVKQDLKGISLTLFIMRAGILVLASGLTGMSPHGLPTNAIFFIIQKIICK